MAPIVLIARPGVVLLTVSGLIGLNLNKIIFRGKFPQLMLANVLDANGKCWMDGTMRENKCKAFSWPEDPV
jgi:hypothetical protein